MFRHGLEFGHVDGSKLRLVTDHSALKWIWGAKSNVNARLFKRSLQLSVLKDKVMIVHHPGRLLRNVDPLSWNPASYHVTLIHMSDERKDKLSEGYKTDPVLRKVLCQLQSRQLKNKKGEPVLTTPVESNSVEWNDKNPPEEPAKIQSNAAIPSDSTSTIVSTHRECRFEREY